jgi:hypothetical protein
MHDAGRLQILLFQHRQGGEVLTMNQSVRILMKIWFHHGFLFLLVVGIVGGVIYHDAPFSDRVRPEEKPWGGETLKDTVSRESQPVSGKIAAGESFPNIDKVNIFDPLYAKPIRINVIGDPLPPNPGGVFRDWKLEYARKKKTIWHFSNRRLKDESYDMEVGKTYTFYDRERPFEIKVKPNGKWGVTFVYPGPPEQRKSFSLVEQ